MIVVAIQLAASRRATTCSRKDTLNISGLETKAADLVPTVHPTMTHGLHGELVE